MTHDVEAVEDLSVDAGFAKDRLGNFAVLAWCSFYQVDNVVDAAVFQTEFLFFVPTIHYRSCQIVRSLPLDDKVKHIIGVLCHFFGLLSFLWCSALFLGLFAADCVHILLIRIEVLSLSNIIVVDILAVTELVSDSQDPQEIAKWQ